MPVRAYVSERESMNMSDRVKKTIQINREKRKKNFW